MPRTTCLAPCPLYVDLQMVPMAVIDPEWSKRQLLLMLREWYQHPNGQMAAYEVSVANGFRVLPRDID